MAPGLGTEVKNKDLSVVQEAGVKESLAFGSCVCVFSFSFGNVRSRLGNRSKGLFFHLEAFVGEVGKRHTEAMTILLGSGYARSPFPCPCGSADL